MPGGEEGKGGEGGKGATRTGCQERGEGGIEASVFCPNRGIERGNGDTKEEIALSFPTS